ncbi:unknown [Clostridium sp. CAG:628]|nr:unknown [Clostridium sp. CAG:628]
MKIKVIVLRKNKEFYQDDLNIFNSYVNKTRIIIDMVDRFIVRGRNSEYDIDYLICGTIDNYVWISKYDLYDLVLSKKCLHFTSPHVACMTLGPQKRCITSKGNLKDRYLVAVRWNFLREDIISFKNNSNQG